MAVFNMRPIILKIVFAIIILVVLIVIGIIFFTSRSVKGKVLTPQQVQQSGALSKYFADITTNIQSTADNNYAKENIEVITSYPWMNKLPVSSKTYFIYFDIKQKQFFGVIYNNNNTENVKKMAIEQLKSMGIPIGKYPMIWKIGSTTPPPQLK